MTVDFLFYSVSAAFLLMVTTMLLLKGYRPWIYGAFSAFFTLLLVLLVLFSLFTPFSEPVELKVTNYSSRRGNLFFFSEAGCNAPVRFDFPVSANEESSLEVEAPGGSFSQILFVTANDSLFYIPVPETEAEKLDIWEKELKKADSCFLKQIEAYQWGQRKYSIIVGLSMFGLLLLFWYRWKRKTVVGDVGPLW